MKLRKVYIEITNSCNFNCSFCLPLNRTKSFITLENFEHVILKVKEVTNHIYLHVLGEPLLHPQFQEIIKITSKHDMQVSITTNSSLIEKHSEFLIEQTNIKQINYSLHSYSEAYNKQQSINQLNKIIKFCNRAINIYHHFRFWVGEQDETQKELITTLEQSYSVELINGENNIKLSPNVRLHFAKQFNWPTESGEVVFESGRCGALRHDCAILVDGSVTPCCLDGNGVIKLGNIYSQPLTEILQSDRALKMKQGFGNNNVVEQFCQTCGFNIRK